MKTTSFLLMTMLITVTAVSQNDNNGQLYLSRSLNADTLGQLSALTVAGNITVTGAVSKGAQVNVYIRSLNGKRDVLTAEEIERRMKAYYRIDIKTENHRLVAHVVQTIPEVDWRKQLIISLEIIIPTDLVVEASAPNGNISLSHLKGTARLSSNSGNFYLNNMAGIISATTSGGNIFAMNCNGRLQLSTEGGIINLAGINGKVQATSHGGSLTATQ